MSKTLNELAKEINKNAIEKGFYEAENNIIGSFEVAYTSFNNQTSEQQIKSAKHAFFAQKIALIHSELSEAIEADRKNKRIDITDLEIDYEFGNDSFVSQFERLIKNTVEDELADVIIRVLDTCAHMNINIEKHIELKMKYNSLREYKHGKNY